MPNGTSPQPQIMTWQQTAITWAAQHVTKTGVVGGAIYVLACFGRAIYHRSLDMAFDATGYAGILLVVAGGAFRAKAANDIAVATAADAKEDRIKLGEAVGAPVMATSAVPAVQRELDKRQISVTGGL